MYHSLPFLPAVALSATGRPIRTAVTRARFPWGQRVGQSVQAGTRGGRGIMLLKNLTFGAGLTFGVGLTGGRPDGGQINSPCARNPGWFSWPGHTGNAVRSAGSSGWGRCPSCARQKEGRGRRARQAGYESCGFVWAGRACQHGASKGPSCQGALFGQSCKKSGASRLMDKADKQP